MNKEREKLEYLRDMFRRMSDESEAWSEKQAKLGRFDISKQHRHYATAFKMCCIDVEDAIHSLDQEDPDEEELPVPGPVQPLTPGRPQ